MLIRPVASHELLTAGLATCLGRDQTSHTLQEKPNRQQAEVQLHYFERQYEASEFHIIFQHWFSLVPKWNFKKKIQ